MSSGSIDHNRYSRTSFVGFAINMLLLEFATWVLLVTAPFYLPFALPVIAVNAVIGWALTTRTGRINHLGRGLLIACLTPLVTLLIFVPGSILTH